MKKTMTKLFLTAAFGLFASLAATAASGDIWSITRCDEFGQDLTGAATTAADPFPAGEPLYFKIRLQARDADSAAQGSRWYMNYFGLASEIVANALTPMQIGIYVSGRLDYATYITDKPEGEACTAVIFKYMTKPGDFAMPIRLATATGPAGDAASSTSYFFNPLRNFWDFSFDLRDDTGTVTNTIDKCNWTFKTEGFIPESLSQVRDYSLEKCGFFVKTIDFSDDAEDPEFWRSIHEDSTITGGSSDPRLDAVSGPEQTTTLYVWSEDESIVYIEGGTETQVDPNDPTVKRRVGAVTFTGGQLSQKFQIRGVPGAQGKITNIVLSAYNHYNYSLATGDRLSDYLTAKVKCIEPMPTTIRIERDDATVFAPTAGDDKYLAAVTRLTISATQAPKADVHVTINTVFQVNPTQTNWGDYVRFSADNTIDTLPDAVAPVVTLTPTDYKKYIYVYALRAETACTIGTGKQVQFKPEVDPAEMAAAEITALEQTGININANPPIITAPIGGDDPIYTVTAGEKLEIPVAVNDTFADMTDTTTGYKVRIKASGSSTAITMPVNYTASGEGGLLESMDTHTSPSVTYPSTPGDVTTTVEVYSPIRKLWSAAATFKVTVTPAKTSSAEVTDDSTEYIEGSTVHYKVSLSDAPSGNVYAFLYNYEESPAGTFGGSGAKAIITDLNNIAPASQGIQITSVGTGATGSFMVLDGISADDGGSTYTFGVVLCTSKTFNPANRVEGYPTTDLINITVYNKDPTFLQLYLNGFESDGDGYTFPNEYPKGQSQTIQPEFDDVSYDLDHGFIYKWTIKKDGKDVTNGIVRHDDASSAYDASSKTTPTIVPAGTRINTASFSYSFPNAGTYEVRVQMRDKDMSRFAVEDRKFFVNIIDQPQVQIVVDDMYLEMSPRDKIHVGLGYFPDSGETVIVKLTVTPPAGDNAGVLTLDSAYKSVPAGYDPLAANEYYVPFTAAGTQDILIEAKDGTLLSSTKGFTIMGEVMNTTESIEPGVAWKDYYRPFSVKAYIENETPIFTGVTLENTNAWKVAGGAATSYPIRFQIKKDVDEDIAGIPSYPGIKVTIMGCESGTIKPDLASHPNPMEFYVTTDEPQAYTFTPNFGSMQGEKTVTLVIEDKDGGSQTWTYLYMIEPSKFLTTIQNGPTSLGGSALSRKYMLSKGRGQGHIFVPGAVFSDGDGWYQNWNCSSATRINVYGWGYRVGAVDNGWLNNKYDIALNVSGKGIDSAASANVTAGFYPYPNAERDSYRYAWIVAAPQTEGGAPELTLYISPENPLATTDLVDPRRVDLPTELTGDEKSYIPVDVEGVFALEWKAADNCGDMNQDGVPDILAMKEDWAGGNLIEVMGGEKLENDLLDLASTNPDEDLLPGVYRGVNRSYAPVGIPFSTRLEIRGLDDGLNATDIARSDVSFSTVETNAYKKAFAAENGRDWETTDGFDLGFWSPEPRSPQFPRMDPTTKDTDGDQYEDGWEYFFWYQAQVWVPGEEDKPLGKPKNGQKFVFERFNPANIIVGTEISAAEVLKRFDPCTPFNPEAYDGPKGLKFDFDGDGLSDLEEQLIGTNPCHWDTDGDKMCDCWEVMHALDPLGGAKHGNPDGDFMAILSLEGHISIEDGIDVDGNTRYVFDVYDQLQYGVDYDFDLAAGGLALIRDVTLTVIGGGEKLNADGTPYTYGLTVAEEMEIYEGNLPIPFHWGSPMLQHIEPRQQVTYAEGTPVAFRDFVIVHDQVRRAFGFDPRTAWNCDAYGYVADRWNPAINGELSPNDTTGVAMYTEPYCDYDEYLIMRYRHDYQGETDAYGSPFDQYGRNIAPVYPDDAKWDTDNIWATINGYTTAPNVTYAKTDIEAILNPTNETGTAYSEGEAANLTATANIADYLAQAFTQAGSDKRVRIGHGADTDGDGAPDGWELYVGRNPNAAPSIRSDEGTRAPWDFDEDRLGFAAEYAGTDSCNAYRNCESIYSLHPGLHSVGNGFQQGWFNKFFPTNPNEPDTDGDGIADGGEGMAWLGAWANGGSTYLVAGTAAGMTFIYGDPQDSITCCVRGGGMNPCTVDTDIDGLPDPWEMSYAGIVVDISTRQYAGPAENFNPEIAEATFIADGVNAPDYTIPENPVYICGGMDATWSGDSWTDPIQGGHSTDARLGTRRDVDFDHDGLQNYQEYLVQQVRHFRYDDITTPIMGRYLDEGEYDPLNPTGPLLAPHVLNVADGFTPMMQDADDFSMAALASWGGEVDQDFTIVSNFVGNTVFTNEFTGIVTYIPKYEVVTNITGSGVVANKRSGTGYNYMFSTPWIEDGWRVNGYMASPLHEWDRMITCAVIQPSIMMPPAGAYVSTDPRIADTDGDGMDDFYEMFHGLNPLLGSTAAGAKDVIATAWGQPNFFNAFWNEWTHQDFNRVAALQGMPGSEDPALQDLTALDPLLYPWAMGTAEADPDGDGLRNDAERITANLTSPITTHTDPTPLWYTDSSSDNSYAKQYYQNTAPVRDMPFWPIVISFDDPYSAQTPDGGYGGIQFLYSFEENEGYDTDNDWKSDGREIVRTFRAPTDPLNFTDPARRQALYLDGDRSWVQSRATFMRDIFLGKVPSVTTVDFFKQFTVEAWIRPEKVGEQTILDRCSLYGYDAINKDNAAIRTNFRLGLTDEGKIYGMFDNDDARVSVRADSESCQTVIGQKVPLNEWTHVAMSYDGKRLVLYVNGTEQASAPTHLIPANGVTVVIQDPTYTNAFTQTSYEAVPGAFFIGGRPETAANNGAAAFDTASISYDSMKNDEWFQGYIDEVRIWDGARTETEIAQWYNKHMTMDDAATNRLEVYTHLMGPDADSSRNDNDGLKSLTAELVQLYDFSDMPGAVNKDDVAQNASGFDNAVRGQLVSTGGISDAFTENVGWWDSCLTKSTAYVDYAIVPWVKNTVHHLPVMDGSVVDSFVYSDYLGGYATLASQHELQKYALNNSAMPYSFYNYYLERYQRLFKLTQLAATNPENETLEDLVCRYEYEVRSDFIGTADLVPMGGAYSKPCPDMWDGQGSSDLWELTKTDTDGDGIPDWWENDNGLDPADPSDWAKTITWNGGEMPAWEAYLRDLSRGMTPDGLDETYASTSDIDGDGLLDWWQNIYALEQGAAGDDDGDGLSNYVEYMLSEVFTLKSAGDGTGKWIRFAPDNAHSVNLNVSDYFYRLNKLYIGEIFTDHDLIKDQWEAKHLVENDNVSPYAYDADIDADADGWSNESEFQSGTKPTVLASLTVDAVQLNEYPVPTIELTIAYHGTQNIGDKPVVAQAWSDQTLATIPDAVWTLGGEGTVREYENGASNVVTGIKHFGMNPLREMLLHLSPGSVVPGTIEFEFKDLSWILYNMLTDQAYTMDPALAIWEGSIIDQPRNDDLSMGDIVRQGYPDESFGTINYATGELKVDFAKFPDWFAMDGDISQTTTGNGWMSVFNLQKSYVRVNWQSKLLMGGRVNTYYLAEADEPGAGNNSLGHVKQGLNTLIAFYDLDNNGKYTPGEPYGMVRNIDVGWNYARASIGLTDTHPSTPRYNLTIGGNSEIAAGGNGNAAADAATDREVIYPSDATDVYTINSGSPAEAKTKVRVRIARFAIDSMDIGLLPQQYMAVVYDRVHDLTETGRPVITEADVLNMASNAFDLDWDSSVSDPNHMTLTSVINEMMPPSGVPVKLADGKTPVAFTNIYYTVYVGNDSIVPLTVTNANILSKAIVRKFAPSRVGPTPIPGATLLEPPAPTFQWRCDDTTYTSFRVRVTGNGVNWTSDYTLLPPRDASGVYSWTPPLRIGAIVPGGNVEFKNGGTYTWEISTYNAKYKSDLWTSGGTFVANVFTNSTDYATARVAVRYYGPDEVASSGKIRVQAFRTPDFSGDPVGEGYVTTLDDIASTNAIKTANATIVGLKTGSYYIRAFIDTDGNGTRSFWTSNADKHYYWESWGCYCTRDLKLGTIFTPRSITVGPGYGANEIIPVYIEDCDTDRDSLPDAWEWRQTGNLTTYGAASIDQNAGGFAMKQSLSGLIETKGALSSGLAVMTMTNLKSPRVAALLLGVNASGTDSQVKSRLNSAQSDASAEPSYVVIKAIELDRDNGKVFITTETAGKETGSTVVLSDIYEFASGSNTLKLTCNIWHRDSLESGDWTIIDTKDVEINKTSTTYEFDLADDVDLASGFFKATLEK